MIARPFLILSLLCILMVLFGCTKQIENFFNQSNLQNTTMNQTEQNTANASAYQLPAPKELMKSDVENLASIYTDMPFAGGQTAPFIAKWVNQNTFMFLQFDNDSVKSSSKLRYLGLGARATFCKETRPSGEFIDFKTYSSPAYEKDDYFNAEQGYFLMRIAVAWFNDGNRSVLPGIDYIYSQTNPPSCGSATPPKFVGPNSKVLSKTDINNLFLLFNDTPFGDQKTPFVAKQISENNFIFLKFDSNVQKAATELQYIGIGVKGTFCKSNRPNEDFTDFHGINNVGYDQIPDARSSGYWILWVAVDHLNYNGEKSSTIGVDRNYTVLDIPDC